jgi:very-short-patch-repair endonuclease
MNLTTEEMDKIYDFLSANKSKFIYAKKESDRNLKLNYFIKDNNIVIYIKDITLDSIFKYLTSHWNKKCENENCLNDRKYIGFFPKRGSFDEIGPRYGNYKFCSKECDFKYKSKRQMGLNNSCHKMTHETFINMCKKNSIKMKENIREGRFIPCVTNSWSKSRCDISFKRDDEIINIKTRSTWEAYFQLFNKHLLYEKLVIPYKFKKEEHNYIVDFVDHVNKIIYEIKPNSTAKHMKNLSKERYARRWCKENGYKYMMIKDSWFKKNYIESIVIGQPCEDKLIRNLKQFKNENKDNKKDRL